MNTPKIRFKGFKDDWEQRKFEDVGTVAMCKRIFKEQTSEEGEVPFYKIGTFGGIPDAYITRELFEEYKKNYQYPNKGDILISASGSIGRTVEYTGKDEYYQDSNIVWLKHENDLDNSFLKVLYGVIEWSCEGSTIKRLYNDNFLKTEFMLPKIEEQIKIGEYFSKLDHLITLHQRKCDETKQLKKFMLQKMFPKNGEKNPEIRFEGFTDAWEQRKLEDVAEFLDTMRKPLEGARRIPGPYPYYGASGIVDYVDGYLFNEELVLLSEDGANITDRNYPVCFLASGKYWVNNHAHVLRLKDGNENNFVCTSLERKDYKQYNSGMAMPKLNQEVCRRIPIGCPSFNEQKKIGDYFRELDNLITLHQRKCEKLKALKKFMLQNMFI